MPVQCPKCGSRYLRDSKQKEPNEKVRRWFFEAAMRCQDCKTRFVGRTLVFGDFFFAHCPRCHRLDLNSWSGKTYVPGGWTGFKIAFGAKRWRCEYCRLNFASFRKRNEIFSFSRWQKLNVGGAVAEGRARMAEMEVRSAVAQEAAEQQARNAAREDAAQALKENVR